MSAIEEVFIKEEVLFEEEEEEDDDDEDSASESPDIIELENHPRDEKVPQHSHTLYWNAYNIFWEWMTKRKLKAITATALLAYFKELSKKYKPPSLWSKYSMLKSTIKSRHNMDIRDFTPLMDYLKEANKGYEPKKSESLSVDDVKRFLSDAPDDEYLAAKVALIIALFGGCRLCDLIKLSNKDVEEHGEIIKITLRNRKKDSIKTFVIEGEMLQPIKAYAALRPENATADRFFFSYRNGKCTNMPIGKNKFGTIPKEIAQFLNLPNPELFTGHSFRKSSASLCKEQGISMSDLKRLSGFRKTPLVPEKKKEQVAPTRIIKRVEKPTEESIHNKSLTIHGNSKLPPKRIYLLVPGTTDRYKLCEPEVKRLKMVEALPKLNEKTRAASNSLPSSDKLILYSYWRSSCSYRVRIALNLKEIPYDLKTINIEKNGGEQHSDEFRKINPMARVPALHIDNHTLIESLNILHYLEETRPQHPLMPTDPMKRSEVRELCDLIASGIQPLQNEGVFDHLSDDQKKEWSQFWITRGFQAIEELLLSRAGTYCVGHEITLADCCLVPQVYNARKFRVSLKAFPTIVRIDKNLEKHPAFKAAHPNNQPDCPTKEDE